MNKIIISMTTFFLIVTSTFSAGTNCRDYMEMILARNTWFKGPISPEEVVQIEGFFGKFPNGETFLNSKWHDAVESVRNDTLQLEYLELTGIARKDRRRIIRNHIKLFPIQKSYGDRKETLLEYVERITKIIENLTDVYEISVFNIPNSPIERSESIRTLVILELRKLGHDTKFAMLAEVRSYYGNDIYKHIAERVRTGRFRDLIASDMKFLALLLLGGYIIYDEVHDLFVVE